MNRVSIKNDLLGVFASTLCLIHCVATPFLFIAKSCSVTCCQTSPDWWKAIDIIFLVVSFFAIFQSTKNSSKEWIKYAMWISWTILLLIIINEHSNIVSISQYAIYVPSFSLIVLHLYSLKYCQCKSNTCCAN